MFKKINFSPSKILLGIIMHYLLFTSQGTLYYKEKKLNISKAIRRQVYTIIELKKDNTEYLYLQTVKNISISVFSF